MIQFPSYEAVVCGGGIAGSMAACAAARKGIKTLLIEEEGYLGGSLTACGTGPMMTFHAGADRVVGGLTQELIERLQRKGLSPGHIIDSTGYTYTVTPFSAEGLKRELELMVLEAGVQLLYHTSVIRADVSDGLLRKITCFSCGETFDIAGEVFVDATGDADLLYLAGVPTKRGREGDQADQPMTMNFKLAGVDIAAIRRAMDETPELFPFLAPKAGIEKQAPRLSFSGFQDIMKRGIREGKISFDRDIVLAFETNEPGEVIVNMTRIRDESAVDPLSITRAEIEGRRQMWELYAFLRENVPGFSDVRLLFSGPRIGVRSSRRLVGIYTLTEFDILKETKFADGIATFGYPIDIHSPDGAETKSLFLRSGASYTIPYRCLINAIVPNILTAGRNISCTFEAQASTRVSPCCGALGHAAGEALALAVRQRCLPTEIDVAELQRSLVEGKAVIAMCEPD